MLLMRLFTIFSPLFYKQLGIYLNPPLKLANESTVPEPTILAGARREHRMAAKAPSCCRPRARPPTPRLGQAGPRFCSHALLAPCASQCRGLRYSGSQHTRAGTHQASACWHAQRAFTAGRAAAWSWAGRDAAAALSNIIWKLGKVETESLI